MFRIGSLVNRHSVRSLGIVVGQPKKSGCTDQDSTKQGIAVQIVNLYADIIAVERAERYLQQKKKFESGGGKYREPLPSLVGVTIFDGSVSKGVTAARYLKEIPQLRHITINEPPQTGTICNVSNYLQTCYSPGNIKMESVTVENRDMRSVLYEHIEYNKHFDVIDLSQEVAHNYMYIDAAVQAISSDGGLLCFSSKDHPALLGQSLETCFARYGSVSLGNAPYRNELALRTLLNAIEASANRYKRHIVPWLSRWEGNCATVYVRIFEDAAEAKHAVGRRIMLYQSDICPTFYTQPLGLLKCSLDAGSSQSLARLIPAAIGTAAAAAAEVAVVKAPQSKEPSLSTLPPSSPLPTAAPTVISPLPALNNLVAPEYRPAQWELPAVCPGSGGAWKVAGPFWGGPLHDRAILKRLTYRIQTAVAVAKGQKGNGTSSRQAGKNTPPAATASASVEGADVNEGSVESTDDPTASAEDKPKNEPCVESAPQLLHLLGDLSEEIDVPFYYALSSLATTLQCGIPPHMEFNSALTNAGYTTSAFHGDMHVVKTNAPPSAVCVPTLQ